MFSLVRFPWKHNYMVWIYLSAVSTKIKVRTVNSICTLQRVLTPPRLHALKQTSLQFKYAGTVQLAWNLTFEALCISSSLFFNMGKMKKSYLVRNATNTSMEQEKYLCLRGNFLLVVAQEVNLLTFLSFQYYELQCSRIHSDSLQQLNNHWERLLFSQHELYRVIQS